MNQSGSLSISCTAISKIYPTQSGSIHALEDVTFSANEQDFICILGPSGCGKTTLLKIIGGILQPTSGEIRFNAEPQNGQFRTSLVFQDQGLFPWMTAIENAAFGLEMLGIPKEKRLRQAQRFIDKFGLHDFSNNYPSELSGGMRQRVAIARAFLANPQILLMDEPFASLDAQTRWVLQEELIDIWTEQRKLIIYVTHDIEESILLADRILVMTGRPGKILEELVVPLPRPRLRLRKRNRVVSELKREIWEMLEQEVREGLQTYS